MIPEKKLQEIAQVLLYRTRANEVEWKRVALRESGEAFQVTFPASIIQVIYYNPETEPDEISFEVRNTRGELISRLTADDGSPGWKHLRELYAEAFRSATKWDEVLSDVEKALATPGKIGM